MLKSLAVNFLEVWTRASNLQCVDLKVTIIDYIKMNLWLQWVPICFYLVWLHNFTIINSINTQIQSNSKIFMLNLSMCAAKQQEVAKESWWYDLYWQGPWASWLVTTYLGGGKKDTPGTLKVKWEEFSLYSTQ